MGSLAQVNMRYIIFITVLMILLMLAVLLTHTEFGKGMKKINSGVQGMVDDISDTADNARSQAFFRMLAPAHTMGADNGSLFSAVSD